jgi:hypothetical protein
MTSIKAIIAAFDEGAEGWPGGGGELLRTLRGLPAPPAAILGGALASIARSRPDAAAQADEPARNAPARPRPPAGDRIPSRRDIARRRERANGSAKKKGRG